MPLRRLLVTGILMELCYLSFYALKEGPEDVLVFIAVNVTTYLLLTFLVWPVRSSLFGPAGEGGVGLVVAFGVLFRLTLLPHPVVGSDDIYRYLWDGRVAASGVNPFSFLPTDPFLSHLATGDLPSKVNHPELRSIYPPLAQAFFWFSNRLFGESAAGLKFLLVVIDCATMVLLRTMLILRGRSTMPLVLYAWSPLPILYFGLDGHLDALGILFLILSLLFFGTSRPVRGSLALGFSVLAKLYPLLVVPSLLRLDKGLRGLRLAALPVVMLALGYLLYVGPMGGAVESLRTFGARWEFNGGIFSLIHLLVGSNEAAHLVCGIMTTICIVALAILKRPFMEKVFWGFVVVILLSPVVHPWYLTWLAALLVVRWSTAVYLFLGLSAITNVVVYQYRAYGQWNDQPLLLIIEYVPVAILLVREIVRHDVLRPTDVSPGNFPT